MRWLAEGTCVLLCSQAQNHINDIVRGLLAVTRKALDSKAAVPAANSSAAPVANGATPNTNGGAQGPVDGDGEGEGALGEEARPEQLGMVPKKGSLASRVVQPGSFLRLMMGAGFEEYEVSRMPAPQPIELNLI